MLVIVIVCTVAAVVVTLYNIYKQVSCNSSFLLSLDVFLCFNSVSQWCCWNECVCVRMDGWFVVEVVLLWMMK